MTRSPYQDLPARAFWRAGVAEAVGQVPAGLYQPRFAIERTQAVATAGSCFAQHIARNLRQRGFQVIDAEPPPPGLSGEQIGAFGYGLYSARYGNIYTTRQLLQLALEALGRFTPADAQWQKDGRWFDALRPGVEPNGLPSREAVILHRKRHLEHVLAVLKQASLFVFTFGLTEAWVHTASGTVYPTAPGTIAGDFDPAVHAFKNFTHAEILADFLAFRALVREINPGVRFLVTVSPVPLTATAGPDHVLTATTYSKSVLRGVAGELYQTCPDIDYFPSYEIITNPFLGQDFYEPNRRAVSEAGVAAVMRSFFTAHGLAEEVVQAPAAARARAARRAGAVVAGEGNPGRPRRKGGKVVCEEALLEAFGK